MPRKNKTIEDLSLAMINGFNGIEEKLEKMATKEGLDKLQTSVDGLAKNVNDFQAELASDQAAHDRMAKYIQALDKRLTRVELRTGIRNK